MTKPNSVKEQLQKSLFKSNRTISIIVGTSEFDQVGKCSADGSYNQALHDVKSAAKDCKDWYEFLRTYNIVSDSDESHILD